MVEMLMGKDPVELHTEGVNLAEYFVSSMEQKNIMDMVHSRVIEEARENEIEAVAMIASKCPSMKGDNHPSIREVAIELRQIQRDGLPRPPNIARFVPEP